MSTGKGVPKLNFSTIKITVGFIADIVLKYDHNTRSWTCAPKDFTLKLISFKGKHFYVIRYSGIV